MTETHVKHSGSFRQITEVHVKHAGSWRDCTEVWAKHAGAWRQVFSSATLALPASVLSLGSDPFAPYYSIAGVKVDADKYLYKYLGGSLSQLDAAYWVTPKTVTASDYECQLVKTSGTTPTGPSLSTWHTISTDRLWYIERSTSGTTSFAGTLYIREIANTSNQVSCGVTLTCENGTF